MGLKTANPVLSVGGCVQPESLVDCFWERKPRPGASKGFSKASRMQSWKLYCWIASQRILSSSLYDLGVSQWSDRKSKT